MADVKLIDAKWVGPYRAALPDGTELIPGESVVKVPEPEVKASENWQPVRGAAKKGEDD